MSLHSTSQKRKKVFAWDRDVYKAVQEVDAACELTGSTAERGTSAPCLCGWAPLAELHSFALLHSLGFLYFGSFGSMDS